MPDGADDLVVRGDLVGRHAPRATGVVVIANGIELDVFAPAGVPADTG